MVRIIFTSSTQVEKIPNFIAYSFRLAKRDVVIRQVGVVHEGRTIAHYNTDLDEITVLEDTLNLFDECSSKITTI